MKVDLHEAVLAKLNLLLTVLDLRHVDRPSAKMLRSSKGSVLLAGDDQLSRRLSLEGHLLVDVIVLPLSGLDSFLPQLSVLSTRQVDLDLETVSALEASSSQNGQSAGESLALEKSSCSMVGSSAVSPRVTTSSTSSAGSRAHDATSSIRRRQTRVHGLSLHRLSSVGNDRRL